MKIIKQLLGEIRPSLNTEAYFEAYIQEENKEFGFINRPGFIIVPGGAYSFVAEREGEPVALRLGSEGYNTFVFHYSCDKPYPQPHLELASMINYIKENKNLFCLSSEELPIVGFSAGGHLVATFSYLYEELAESLRIKAEQIRPTKIVLAYPVISMKIPTNSCTSKRITNNFDSSLVSKLSAEENIDKHYPITYIWSSKGDKLVPFRHSQIFVESLIKNNIKHRFVLYNNVDHGISIANLSTALKHENFIEAKDWLNDMLDFIR